MAFIPDTQSTFKPEVETKSTFIPDLAEMGVGAIKRLRPPMPHEILTAPFKKIPEVSERGKELEAMAQKKIEEKAYEPSEYPVAKGLGLGALSTALDLAPKTPEQGLEYAAAGKAIPFATRLLTKRFPVLAKPVGELFKRKPKPISTITPAELEFPKKVVEGASQAGELPVEKIVKPEGNPFKELADALEKSKPVRETQEMMYSIERGKRFQRAEKAGKEVGGEAGLKAMMSRMKGELKKPDFEPIQISQQSKDAIAQSIIDATNLTTGEKLISARGLKKITDGVLPTEGEIDILSQILPDDIVQAVLKKQPFGQRLKGVVLDAAGIPRSIMASADLSFGGRQGIFSAPRFKKEFWNSWKKQFEIFGSEKAYQKHIESLVNDPDFLYAKESGVAFTDIGRRVRVREERFSSKLAEGLPLIRQSARAYTAFANQYRMDIFKRMVQNAETAGLKIRDNAAQSRRIARLVNAMTGRGSLGKLEANWEAAQLANAFFFSPRLISSRVTLLNPVTYMQKDKFARTEALKTLSGFLGFTALALGVAKQLGADIELNPTSADFGKIKLGNTRIDVMGGLQQYAVLISRLLANKITSTTTGKVIKLGEGYRPLNRLSVLGRFLEYKEAPVPSLATSLLRGKTAMGEEMSGWQIPKEVATRFIPMVVQDLYDLYNDDPSLIPLAVLPFFGFGLQTYGLEKPSKNQEKRIFESRKPDYRKLLESRRPR